MDHSIQFLIEQLPTRTVNKNRSFLLKIKEDKIMLSGNVDWPWILNAFDIMGNNSVKEKWLRTFKQNRIIKYGKNISGKEMAKQRYCVII